MSSDKIPEEPLPRESKRCPRCGAVKPAAASVCASCRPKYAIQEGMPNADVHVIPFPQRPKSAAAASVLAGAPGALGATGCGCFSYLIQSFEGHGFRESPLSEAVWSVVGAAVGGSTGGIIALLCGCHVPRWFSCLFSTGIAAVICLFGRGPLSMRGLELPHVALAAVLFGGGASGAAALLLTVRFGRRSRIGAATCGAVFFVAGLFFAETRAATEAMNHPSGGLYVVCVFALLASAVGALAGAMSDSAGETLHKIDDARRLAAKPE